MTSIEWQRTYVEANGLQLHLEAAGPEQAEPIILVMGLGCQLIQWPESLCAELLQRGFRVIRFDNRDIGLSADADRGIPFNMQADFIRVRLGRPPGPANYLLQDMAADTVGLMDALGIKRAHIAGVSMGGMICQLVAAIYPERVLSLSSIMSGCNHPWTRQTDIRLLLRIASGPPDHDRETMINRSVETFRLIGSPAYPTPVAELRAFAQRAFDRAFRPGGVLRHTHAIVATGGFERLLANVSAPTQIIHGTADRMLRPACGMRSARFIPEAKLELIEGMGHDCPQALMPRWAELIANNAGLA